MKKLLGCSLILLVLLCQAAVPCMADDVGKNIRASEPDGPFVNFATEEKIEKLNEQISKLFDQGKYEESLPLAASICRLSGAEFGLHHGEYARALNNYGWLLQACGNYNDARKQFENALAIQEKFCGTGSLELSPILNNLASLLAYQGDYASAIPLLQRSLKLQEAAYGKDDIQLAATLNNLAVVLDASGRASEALPVLERALAISEKNGQYESADFASQITNLALLYESARKFEQAEILFLRVKEIRRKSRGINHPDYAEILNNLAMVKAKQGAYVEAHKLLTEAYEIYTAALGAEHPDVATTLNNLARIELLTNEKSKAQENLLRAAHIIDHHIFSVLPFLSFAEQRAFLSTRVPEEISLLLSYFQEGQPLQESYFLIMRWKGLLIESLRRQSILKAMSAGGKQSGLAQQLLKIRQELSELHHYGKQDSGSGKATTIAQLTKEKELLERRLADSVEGQLACDPLHNLDAKSFSTFLSANECLVDIYKFQKEGAQDQQEISESTYAAIVVSPSAPLQYIELGNSKTIEKLVLSWRRLVLAQGEGTAQWQALREQVWDKISIAGNKQGTKYIFLSPEANLARLPWHLFVDLDGSDNQARLLSEVDSPRELALLKQAGIKTGKTVRQSVLLVGNIDFGNPERKDKPAAPHDPVTDNSLKLPPLPGTKQELDAIAALAAQKGYRVMELTQEDATKEAVVTALPLASCAHFATHGFFQAEGVFTGRQLKLTNTKERPETGNSRNPLLQSGLVLSASRHAGGGGNDLLTAEELVGLDLSNCSSFVLSACETGLGEGETGQGVLGLRSSIMAAGAGHVLLSLWKVPDEATQKLMACFYENLWQKELPPAEALRQAQKTIREEKYERFQAPVHWAAWVLIGQGWGK